MFFRYLGLVWLVQGCNTWRIKMEGVLRHPWFLTGTRKNQ
jgi:hypothetical protein